MHQVARVQHVLALLVVVLLWPSPVRASSRPPEECTFRTNVVRSDLIVVGRITATTAPSGDSLPDRVSWIEVDAALYGGVSVGDTVGVWWQSAEHLTEPRPIGMSWPQLDELTGDAMLYLLREEEHLELTTSWPPPEVSSSGRVALCRRLFWLRDPPPCDMLGGILASPRMSRIWIGRDSPEVDLKLGALEAFLGDYLGDLGVSCDDVLGRSN